MHAEGIVIFDVDGTLSCTSEVDDRCWMDAAAHVIGVRDMSTDWSTYSHSTDEAIATDLIRDRTDLEVGDDVVHRIRDDFAVRIEAAIEREPGLFRPVGGAPEVFMRLRQAGWRVAIATGGWRRTAELKLATAGVPFEGVAAAHADDAHPRERIVELAARRALHPGESSIAPVVYVGDGIWDVRATRRLGIGFVGVGTGAAADRLRDEGAEVVLPDFRDETRFMEAVAGRARGVLPGPAGSGC